MSQHAMSRRLRLLPWIRAAGAMLCLICVVAVTGFIEYAVAQSSVIMPVVETVPTRNGSDSADDPAIWIHPTDPSKSVIIGADKAEGVSGDKGGLTVYDLDGTEIQFVQDGKTNNVDLRYNFPFNGKTVDLVTATNQYHDSLSIFIMNPVTRLLEPVAARIIQAGMDVYGTCMYRSPTTGKYYQFVTSESGVVQQWHLFDNRQGKVDAVKVDQFTARFEEVGSLPEGCVADDIYGHLYISGTSGLWKYNAEPGTVRPIRKVDSRESGRLGGDLEGVAIYHLDATTGYLLVSDQNRSAFAVYQREGNNDFITTFKIRANDNLDIDEVSGTDGIDVTNVALGAAFPHGVFVAHDTNNTATSNPNSTRYKSNYKLVRWDDIAKGVEPTLNMSTIWNPRHGGSSDTPSPTTPAPTPAPTPSPTPTPTDRVGCPPATAVGTALTVAADARVEEESPNTNYGSDTVLRVDGGSDPDAESYLRFDVNTASPVRRATLRVYSFSGSSQAPAVYTSSPSWSESSITWSTRPARSGTPIATAGAVQQNCYIEYDVTAAIPGNGSYSFVLATSITDGVRLSSREGAQPPQLILSLDNQRVLMPLIVR